MSTLGRLNWFLAEAERILARKIEELRNDPENSFARKLEINSWRHHIEELKTKIEKEHLIEH
jgi:hypothetical protein